MTHQIITLTWHGPYHLAEAAARAAFDPPQEPGVYLWLTGRAPQLMISYVGQTANLQKRFYEHAVSMLGGGYWLYDTASLASDPKPTSRYTPSHSAYFTDFLADWESNSRLAYDNLLSYTFAWATFPSDKLLRESVESALIYQARQVNLAHQNPRASRHPSVSLAVSLEHHLPVGLQVAGLITPTEFGVRFPT